LQGASAVERSLIGNPASEEVVMAMARKQVPIPGVAAIVILAIIVGWLVVRLLT
jgi:hypothetical protein